MLPRGDVRCRFTSSNLTKAGHYKTLMWNENTKGWEVNPAMGIHVSVEVSGLQAVR